MTEEFKDAEPTLVEALCEETKLRELTPADFPNPKRNKLDVEMPDAEKIVVARAAAANGRWYTASRVLANLKDQPALQLKGDQSVPRLVRRFLEYLP